MYNVTLVSCYPIHLVTKKKDSKLGFWSCEVLPVPILHCNPTHHRCVCLLPEARIAASWQIVGGGRRQGQPCLQAWQGPPELQPPLVLTTDGVFMGTEAASADQEIRPCDTALEMQTGMQSTGLNKNPKVEFGCIPLLNHSNKLSVNNSLWEGRTLSFCS